MITNERQYKITRAQVVRFQHALDTFNDHAREGVHPFLVKAERDALESQLADLREELGEYERLKSADTTIISISSFNEFADGLIKARIAAGISQKELAERLGIKEQQIQRYEAKGYDSASYQRMRDIANALGVQIRNDILMPIAPVDIEGLLLKLNQVGLDRDFVFSRLIPSLDITYALERSSGEEDSVLSTTVAALEQVFGWTRSDLFNSKPLPLEHLATSDIRFKIAPRGAQVATSLYASYANYLARVVLKAARDLPQRTIPTDAGKVRQELFDRYGGLTLDTVLRYSWDLGVPVFPLKERGVFHNAFWRYKGRNITILKQKSQCQSRWLFDLLRGMFHAAQQPGKDNMEVIEADEASAEWRNSEQENAAGRFAGDVMLDGRAEELAQACIQAAEDGVKQLKDVIPSVAKREKVEVDALVNYMNFRLYRQNTIWRSIAINFQSDDDNPWLVARDIFRERFCFRFETELDEYLLTRALE